MQRLSPSWRHACLLITGTLVITGCGSEGASTHAPPARGQSHSLDHGSDLVITELRAPDSVRDGNDFTATVKVCNQGSASAYPQGSGTFLQLYLSTTPTQQVPDPNAPPPTQQITVGQKDVGPLEPHQCVTRTVTANAMPPPGQPGTAFYLGASIDTSQQVQELDETNNGFVRGLMGVGLGPDLVVSEVKTPASTQPGRSFLVDVRVCNVGTEPSSYTSAEFYLSTLDTLSLPTPGSPTDTQVKVGVTTVPPLEADHCLTVRAPAYPQLPPAATQPGQPLYVGAIVDPQQQGELREDNNTRVAGRLSMGNQADLVVTDVTGPTNIEAGMPISSSVTVCNVGMDRAMGVRAEVLLSTEASLSASQQPGTQTESLVGQAQAPGLDAGRCVTLPVSGFAYPPPVFQPGAPLYLGARVDGMQYVPELRDDNNTLTKGTVGVGYGPDLVVRSLKGPVNLPDSYSFPVAAQVCNVGTGPLYGHANLELYLSTEAEVTLPPSSGPSPMQTQASLGVADVSYLSAGQCQTVRVNAYRNLPLEAQPGQPLYLGAAIDAFRSVQELNEDNNTFIQGLVGTGPAPDLVITDVRAPANLRDGQPFSATYTVCNQGASSVDGYGVSLFLSTETEPPVSRQYPATPVFAELPRAYAFQGRAQPYTMLAAGQCTTQRSTFHASRPIDWMPAPLERPLNLSAVVDMPGFESRMDNNGFAAGIVGLGDGPDLVITEIQGPASVRPGNSFTSKVKVCNVGTQPLGGSARVALYLSVDDTLPAPEPMAFPPMSMGGQRFVGDTSLPPLAPGDCTTREISGWADAPPDAIPFRPLYLGAVVNPDAMTYELRWDNNTRVAGAIGVGNGPDLVVTAVEAPSTVAPWEPFAATVRVCNVGTDAVSSTEVALVVSTEETWNLPPQGSPAPSPNDPSQFMAGLLNVAPLQAGQCVSTMGMVSVDRPLGASPEQPLYLSAAVDPFQSRTELREDNNVFVKGRLGVGTEADLLITALTPPASIRYGQSFTTTLTVCNQGSQSSWGSLPVTLQLLQHPEMFMPPQGAPQVPPEEFLGEFFIPQLAAHTCITLPVSGNYYGYTSAEPLTYYVGATVDRYWSTPEVRKDNNTFVGPRVGVGNAPDLVITAMGGPENLEPHGQAQVPVTVCNQGTQPSSTQTVDFFISTSSTPPELTFPGGDPASGVSLAGSVEIPSLPENACITREGTLQANTPAAAPEAPLFVGAFVRAWSPNDELRTDNNAFVRGRIGVGNAPDLVVTEVVAPFAVRWGETFSTTVTVCNQGTQPSGGNSQVKLLLSTQPTLAFPDETPDASTQVPLGELDVGSLEAGGCTTRQLLTSANTLPGYQGSGLFYLGALVDSQRSVTELREDNNAFVENFLAVLP
ncbi:CARDB domain-containing protein [Corallococcus exiguus]|uniref:CARDB domain-containing protein n=1 Tax=Corallococcus exiguus TaxID=83462 RepID=UPI003DA2B50F